MENTAIMSIKSIGYIRYSPKNNGKIIRRDGGTTKWWMVLDCDPKIGEYYRKLFKMLRYGVETIQNPTWGAHISVVADEKPLVMEKWRFYSGMAVEFEYSHISETNGYYVWQPVFCNRLLDMREELGLKRNPRFPLHLTIGNSK